jgi:hypothetical protein
MPTNENKRLAKVMRNILACTPNIKVVNHLNPEESLGVDILYCPESPWEGFTTYATIGLSDYPMYNYGEEEEFHVRLEILGVCNSDIDWFPNILATCGFYLIQEGWLFSPGFVLKNIAPVYDPDIQFKHIYFSEPFVWEELHPLQLETKKVAWLLCILISDAECHYREQNGSDKLETLLDSNDVHVFDLARKSVL